MDSFALYRKANSLVQQCGTRDPEKRACEIDISIFPMETKTLLSMYTFRWKHRMIFLNPRMDEYLRKMVIAHKLGHDSEHRDITKKSQDGLKEFSLFKKKDNTEYESNAFGCHILLDNDEVYEYARAGYDVIQLVQVMSSAINLMLIKLQEMNKLGYDFRVPYSPGSRFFRNIRT